MLCIFKTPLVTALDTEGNPVSRFGALKMRAKLAAGDVQLGIESAIGQCAHARDIQFRQNGAKRLTLQDTVVVRRRADRSPAGATEVADAKKQPLPFFSALYSEETESIVVGEAVEAPLNRVKVSPSLVKPDASPVMLADFPDNFAFGNGTTVGVTVPLKGFSQPVTLSWCLLESNVADAVLADPDRYETLRRLMEE